MINSNTRVGNALINALSRGLGIVLISLAQLIGRIIFTRILDYEYLGVYSLFTNVFSMLDLARIGITSAICYKLYEPIKNQDYEKIKAIMQWLRHLCFILGFIVIILGSVFYFFLPLIALEIFELPYVKLAYFSYVFKSASAYWFGGYKSILLQANQKLYIQNIYYTFSNILTIVLQIISLLLYQNFLVYSYIGILSIIMINYSVAHKVNKMYPYIREKGTIQLQGEEKREIAKDIFSVSFYKINSTIESSVDNMIISAVINVRTVGIYGNYQLIINGLTSVVSQIFDSITATIGNFNVGNDKKNKYFVYNCLKIVCYSIYSFIGTVTYIFIDYIIEICFGIQGTLNRNTVLLLVLFFTMNGFYNIFAVYRNVCGIFTKGRIRPLITMIINVILSIVCAHVWQIQGIIMATIVSWVLTTWWFEPYLIYKTVFQEKPYKCYFQNIIYTFGLVGIWKLCNAICTVINFSGIIQLFVNLFLSLSLVGILNLIMFYSSEEFRYLIKCMKMLVRGDRKSRKSE